MAPFLQLGATVCTEIIKVPRENLRLDHTLNPRRNYGDLGHLGASLDACGQTTPLIVVEVSPGCYLVRDGDRRVVSVDQGYAPRRQSTSFLWDCTVLRTSEGGVPPERDIRRWCAATNMARKNWLPIERAVFYQAEIDDALADRLHELNQHLNPGCQLSVLSPKEERQVKKATKLDLATLEGKRSDQTIQNHLHLLELAPCVREQLYKGNISQDAARQFRGLTEEDATLVLADVAQYDQVDLAGSHIPGDLQAPTERDAVEDVFANVKTPWFVPSRVKAPVGDSGEAARRIIRALTVRTMKSERRLEGKKTKKTWMRGTGEIRKEIDRLNTKEYLTEAEQTQLQTLQWVVRGNHKLPHQELFSV